MEVQKRVQSVVDIQGQGQNFVVKHGPNRLFKMIFTMRRRWSSVEADCSAEGDKGCPTYLKASYSNVWVPLPLHLLWSQNVIK